MASSEIWIAPLIERSLKYFLDGSESQIHQEDDGSNLRFADNSQYSALIDKWTEEETLPTFTLTDTKTQIQAILARESLEEYHRDYVDRPLTKDGARGYFINLMDFELVFEYATSGPKVHLHVKRFSIAWEKSRFKGPPQGRMIRRNKQVYSMMRAAFQKARSRETACTGRAEDGDPSDSSIKSQNGDANGKNGLQEPLMSQMPPVQSTRALWDTSNQPLANAEKLLKSFNANTRLPQTVQPKNIKEVIGSGIQKESPASQGIAEKIHNSQPPAETSNEPLCAQLSTSVSIGEAGNQDVNATTKVSDQVTSNTADKPLSQDVHDTAPSMNDIEVERLKDSNNTEEKQPSRLTQETSSKQASPTQENSLTYLCTNAVNPWEGMTEIRKADVAIPKDQAALLEQHAVCWVPPEPGKSNPQGNVPPQLLQQWNSIALRRSLRERERQSEEFGTPEPQASCPTSPGIISYSESDSDASEALPWNPSPQRPPSQHLPVDSSPSITRSFGRGSTLNRRDEGNIPAEQPLDDEKEGQQLQADQGSVQGQEDVPELNGAHELENSSKVASTGSSGQISCEPQAEELEIDNSDTRACTQGFLDDSDRMSEDSVMDTFIPHPLGVDPSQSDHEVNSSNPSLPGLSTQVRVQVMETPMAYLDRFHPGDRSTGNTNLRPHSSGHESQIAKSSSQSRILNTYCSNDEPKGSASQDTPHLTQPNGSAESNGVDIWGTQLSSGNWPCRNTSPHSNSALVLNSPELRQRGGSVIIIASSGEAQRSSNPFSSYREAPSSMQADEENHNSVGIPSLTQYTPSMHNTDGDQIPLLKKRGVFEIDTEQLSPSKRQKTARDDGEVGSVQGSVANIISRRQSYINRFADSAESQKVYEKFCADYPEYLGDFGHFTMMCSKLQCFRAQGNLKWSFLWDDFVIMHLEEYPRHLQSLVLGSKSLSYEEYFLSNYSRPLHKKRSLTADGIGILAEQYVSSSAAAIPEVKRQETNTSFTGSLVDKLTNFHAHSFGPEIPGPWSEPDVGRLSQNPPAPGDGEKSDAEAFAEDLPMGEEFEDVATSSASYDSFHDDPPPARMFPNTQLTPRLSPSFDVNRELDTEGSVPETEPNQDDVEYDLMDETHEIASIELGDGEDNDNLSTAAQAPLSDTEFDAMSEADSFDEDWVESHCRQLGQTGPFWSDDPNTPFKMLARVDANVLSERMRRGMARLPVDANGVIQPPVQSPIPSVRDFLNRAGNPSDDPASK